MRPETFAFIEERAIPEPNTGCWLWDRSINNSGYGTSSRGLAHRVVYEIENGALLCGEEVDHICRMRSCVNPDHLVAVSRSENMRLYSERFWVDRGCVCPACGATPELFSGAMRCRKCFNMRERNRYRAKTMEVSNGPK